MEFKIGDKVHFSESSGNDTATVHVISAVEEKEGRAFYSLEGDAGGLYVAESLSPALDESLLEQKPEEVETSTVDPSPVEETKEERMKRLNISDLPGHTYETEQIQKQRQEELAKEDPKPYEFKANGYTVTEIEGKDGLPATYLVTAEGYEKGFGNKREAEIWAETHARHFAD